jgi:hypothetical protein
MPAYQYKVTVHALFLPPHSFFTPRAVLIEHLPTEVTSAAVEAAVRKKFLFYGNILYSKVVSSDLIPPLMSTTPTTSTLHILAHRLRRYPRERRFGIVHYEEPYMASRAAAAMSFPTTSASLGSHALDWRIGKRDKEKDTNNGFASAWLEKVSVSYEPVAEGTTAVTAAPARKMQNHDSIRQESLLMNLDGAYGAMIAERQQQTVGLQIAGGGSKHIQPQQQQQQQQALAFEQAQMQAHAMFFAHAAAAAGMGDYPFPFLPPHAFASNTFHTPQYYPSAFGMQHPLQIQMPQQLPPPQLMPNPSRHPSASAGSGLPALQTVPSGSAAVPAYQQFYQQGLVQQIQTHTQSPPAPNQLDVPRPPLQSSMPALLQQPEVSQMAANQQMTFSLLPSVSTIPINTSRSYAGAASKYLGQMLQPGAEGEGNSDGRAAAATIALNMNLGLGLTAYLMAPTGGFSYREMSSESATDMHEPNRGLRIRRNAAASKQRNIVCDVSENVRGMNLFPAFNSLLSPGLSSEDLVGGDRIPMATLVPYSVLSPLSFHRHTPGMNSPQSPGHAVLAGSPRPHFL